MILSKWMIDWNVLGASNSPSLINKMIDIPLKFGNPVIKYFYILKIQLINEI